MGFEFLLRRSESRRQALKGVLSDFIGEGFEATVVAADDELLGEDWVGRKTDARLLEDLNRLKDESDVRILGDRGEYYTLVTDGPIFDREVRIGASYKILRGRYWTLDILEYELGVP